MTYSIKPIDLNEVSKQSNSIAMAGPSRDGKDALIYYGTAKQKYNGNQLARYAAIGNTNLPYNKTTHPFGWSGKAKSGELVFVLDRPGSETTDYFFRLENFNIGAYVTPNDYPSKDEINKKEGLQGGTPLVILAGEAERNSIILPARQGEAKWVAQTTAGSNNPDSTNITRDLDNGRKTTITGRGGDIVISGHGDDYIGPGLPLEAWKALGNAAKNGTDWVSTSKIKTDVDLGSVQLLTPVKGNRPGATQVQANLWIGNLPINSKTTTTGKKAYIGGSGDDVIWGGNEADLLVGDRWDSYEAYFPSNEQSRQALYAAAGYTNVANSPIAQLQTRFTPENYNGSTQKEPGYNSWYGYPFQGAPLYTYYAYMNGPLDNKYFWTRTGKILPNFAGQTFGRSPQYDGSHTLNQPVWTPGADRIFGGGGDDTIYGDNNLPAAWRIQEAKELYNKPNSEVYYQGDMGIFEKQRQLGNDYINGGDGNDNINGGFGVDYIIGGKGSDIIFMPDVITAPGFKNLNGPSGNVSWIAGGDLSDTAKLMADTSGVNKSAKGETDIFVLGMNYTSEQAMKNRQYDDGGGSSYEAELQRLENLASTKWKEFATLVATNVAKDAASNLPVVGAVISPLLGIIDALLEKENDPSNKGISYDAPPAATDATAVISDFSPTDVLVIPVPKGGKCVSKRVTDGGGLNFNDPQFPGFNTRKQGTMISLGSGTTTYDRVWLPGLTYDNTALNPDYQFYRLKSSTDLNGYGIANESSISQFGDNVDLWVFANKYFDKAFGGDQGILG